MLPEEQKASAEAAAPAAPAAAAPKSAEPQETPKAEKQTNCPICNKPIKRLTRYYRDGKFYCARKCWRQTQEKSKQERSKEEKQ